MEVLRIGVLMNLSCRSEASIFCIVEGYSKDDVKGNYLSSLIPAHDKVHGNPPEFLPHLSINCLVGLTVFLVCNNYSGLWN